MEPTIVLTALLPVLTDVVKSVVSRFTGNKPVVTSADDYSKVVSADIQKLEALAKLESPNGQTSRWVNDAKVLQRITVVYAVLASWIVATFIIDVSPDKYTLIANLAGSIFFYLFGDRVNFYARSLGR